MPRKVTDITIDYGFSIAPQNRQIYIIFDINLTLC